MFYLFLIPQMRIAIEIDTMRILFLRIGELIMNDNMKDCLEIIYRKRFLLADF